jgi:hypothetical protein
MRANLSGFGKFFERVGGMTTRPDQVGPKLSTNVSKGHGPDGTMDSFDVQGMELGLGNKAYDKAATSVPTAGGNVQIGNTFQMGNSSYTILDIGDKMVKVQVNHDGDKNLLKRPGGLFSDPINHPPEIEWFPRWQIVALQDGQWGDQSGAQAAGMGAGGLPPMGGM